MERLHELPVTWEKSTFLTPITEFGVHTAGLSFKESQLAQQRRSSVIQHSGVTGQLQQRNKFSTGRSRSPVWLFSVPLIFLSSPLDPQQSVNSFGSGKTDHRLLNSKTVQQRTPEKKSILRLCSFNVTLNPPVCS